MALTWGLKETWNNSAKISKAVKQYLYIHMWDKIPWNRGSAIANYRFFCRVGKCGHTFRPEAEEFIFVIFFGNHKQRFIHPVVHPLCIWSTIHPVVHPLCIWSTIQMHNALGDLTSMIRPNCILCITDISLGYSYMGNDTTAIYIFTHKTKTSSLHLQRLFSRTWKLFQVLAAMARSSFF